VYLLNEVINKYCLQEFCRVITR